MGQVQVEGGPSQSCGIIKKQKKVLCGRERVKKKGQSIFFLSWCARVGSCANSRNYDESKRGAPTELRALCISLFSKAWQNAYLLPDYIHVSFSAVMWLSLYCIHFSFISRLSVCVLCVCNRYTLK